MQQRCPSCGRTWVPGEGRCPFCGATLGAPAPPGMTAGLAPALLQWVDRQGMLQRRPIPPQGLRLGRDPGNDVVLDDPQVSRQHALIFLQGGQCYIQDLGSANGTWVNEQRIVGSQLLRVGDRLRLGETSFALAAAPVAAPAAPVGYPYPVPPAVRPVGPVVAPAPQAAAQLANLTAGRILTLIGGLDMLVMFFLPWLRIIIGISALDLLRSVNLLRMLGYEMGIPGSLDYLWLLILVPLAGLVSLALTIVSLFLERHQQAPLFYPQIALAVLAMGAQIALLVILQGELSRELSAMGMPEVVNVISLLDVGYWLSLVGAVLIIAGSILGIIRLRQPSARMGGTFKP